MKKPSWKILGWLFFAGWLATTVVFAVYHLCRVRSPALKTAFDAAALDTNAITAYFTALAFVGFLITTIYQAHSNAATEKALDDEKKKNLRLRHDTLWLTVQIARLHSFPDHDENRAATRKEIEDHWGRLSKEIADELK